MLHLLPRGPATPPHRSPAPGAEPPGHRCAPPGALASELAFEFADGQTEAAAHTDTWRHLAGCAPCRAKVAHARALLAAVARAERAQPVPASLRRRVAAALATLAAERGARSHSRR